MNLFTKPPECNNADAFKPHNFFTSCSHSLSEKMTSNATDLFKNQVLFGQLDHWWDQWTPRPLSVFLVNTTTSL